MKTCTKLTALISPGFLESFIIEWPKSTGSPTADFSILRSSQEGLFSSSCDVGTVVNCEPQFRARLQDFGISSHLPGQKHLHLTKSTSSDLFQNRRKPKDIWVGSFDNRFLRDLFAFLFKRLFKFDATWINGAQAMA